MILQFLAKEKNERHEKTKAPWARHGTQFKKKRLGDWGAQGLVATVLGGLSLVDSFSWKCRLVFAHDCKPF